MSFKVNAMVHSIKAVKEVEIIEKKRRQRLPG